MVVHVVPRSARSQVVGRHGAALKIRIAAPPVDGAANTELVRFLAEQLRVPRSAVTVLSGASGRRKTVSVEGITTAAAERTLLEETA